MRQDIDFLKAYRKKTEPAQNIFRFLKKGLILITIIYCVCLAGVFAYWSFLRKNFQEINSKVELKRAAVKQHQKKEFLYFLLKNQLSSLSKVISKDQENYSQIFSSLFQSAENKVEISEIKILGGKTEIYASAPTAFSLAGFLDEIAGSEDMRGFSKIILNSLSRSKEEGYSFSMTFSYD